MAVALNGRSGANFVTHHDIDLEVFSFVVGCLEPLVVFLNELIVARVFFVTPVVTKLLVSILTFFRME
jgi:hypothetical protein